MTQVNSKYQHYQNLRNKKRKYTYVCDVSCLVPRFLDVLFVLNIIIVPIKL